MARQMQELGVRPELEVFDTGHLVFAKELIARRPDRRPRADPALHGHPLRRAGRPGDAAGAGAPPAARGVFSAFSIGRMQLPYVAMAVLAGGNVRVGLEDNLYLSRGVQAPTASSSSGPSTILEAMNVRVLGPAEVRERLRAARHGMRSGRDPGRPARRRRDRRRLGGALSCNGVDVRVYDPRPRGRRAGVRRCSTTRGAPGRRLTLAPRRRGRG